jgi:hypothetical protein
MVFEKFTFENVGQLFAHLEYAFNAYLYYIRTQWLPEIMAKIEPLLQFLRLQFDRLLDCLFNLIFLLTPLSNFLKPVLDKTFKITKFFLWLAGTIVYLIFYLVLGSLVVSAHKLTGSEVPGVAIFTAAALYGFYTFLPALSEHCSKLSASVSIMVPRVASFMVVLVWLPFIWIAANIGAGLTWLISVPLSVYNVLPSRHSILALFPTTDDVLALRSKVASGAIHMAQKVPSIAEVKSSLTPSNLIRLLAKLPSLTAATYKAAYSFASTITSSIVRYTVSGLTLTRSSICSIAMSIYAFALRTVSSTQKLLVQTVESAITLGITIIDWICFLCHRVPVIFTQCLSWIWMIISSVASTCFVPLKGVFHFLHDTRVAIGQDHIWFSLRLSDIVYLVFIIMTVLIYGLYTSKEVRRLFCLILHAIVNFYVLCLGGALVFCDKVEYRFNRLMGVPESLISTDASIVPPTPGRQTPGSRGPRCPAVKWFMPWFTRSDDGEEVQQPPQMSAASDTAFILAIRNPRAVFSESWQWTLATLTKGKILGRQFVQLISYGVDPLQNNVLGPIKAWLNLNVYKDQFQEASHYNVYTISHVQQMLDRLSITLLNKDSNEPWIGIDLKGKDAGVDGQNYYMVIRDYDLQDTYLVDLTRLEQQAFTTCGSDGRDLTGILECESVLKLVFNIGPLANTLACDFGIHVCGVLDLQLMQAMTGPTDPTVWADFEHSIDSQTQEDPSWSGAASLTNRPVFDGNYARFQQRPLAQDLKNYCISDVSFFLDLYTAKLPLAYGRDRFGALFNRSHLHAVKAYSDAWNPTMNAIDEDLVRTLRVDESPRATVLSMDTTNIPLPATPAQPMVLASPVTLPPSPLPVQPSTEMEASVPLPDTPAPIIVVGEPTPFPPSPVRPQIILTPPATPVPASRATADNTASTA